MESRQLSNQLAKLLNHRALMAFADEIEFVSSWRWARYSLLVGAVVGLIAAGVCYVLEWARPSGSGAWPGSSSRRGRGALALPWVFATGYGWMQDELRPIDDPARPLPVGYKGFALLPGIAVAKMLATTCTVGWGGSGGIFAPTLFIGGFIGGAFGTLFHQLAPDICTQPGAFVLVGVGAFYAGIGRVPIATIILISELFGSYDLRRAIWRAWSR